MPRVSLIILIIINSIKENIVDFNIYVILIFHASSIFFSNYWLNEEIYDVNIYVILKMHVSMVEGNFYVSSIFVYYFESD